MKHLPVSYIRLLEHRVRKWTRIGTIALAILLVLVGGGALYFRTAAGQVGNDLALVNKQLTEASWRLKEAGNHPQFPSRSAYVAIRDFQKELDRIAVYRGCTITAFQVAGDPNPFTTVFGKEKADSTWTQGSVRFQGHKVRRTACPGEWPGGERAAPGRGGTGGKICSGAS